MCVGFFLISGLEELFHHFLHPHQTQGKDMKIKMNSFQETSYTNGTKKEGGFHIFFNMEIFFGNISEKAEIDDVESEKTAAQVKSAIRTVFVVSALSFHSTIEGDDNEHFFTQHLVCQL